MCVETTNASKGNCSVLSHIHLPKEAILCKDANCTRVEHKRDLFSMYDNVVLALYDGGNPFHNMTHRTRSLTADPAGMSM